MNRDQLEEAIATERYKYYRAIAKLIVDNPELSLKDLRIKHGLSCWAVDRARRLFKLSRKRGAGSSAYNRPQTAHSPSN